MKHALKSKAIKLRKLGKTYSEILKVVPVAKSTLSLWLREVGLSKKQNQKITQKRLDAAWRGGQKRKNDRIVSTTYIQNEAIKEVGNISKRELLLMGAMLYWAEGAKEKSYRPSSRVDFSNSDSLMIRLFLKWLFDICEVKKNDVKFGIYIHENSKNRINEVRKWWSRETGFGIKCFEYVYFKKHNPLTKRKNVGEMYYGNLRVYVKASTSLNRRISGWVKGVSEYYWGVV